MSDDSDEPADAKPIGSLIDSLGITATIAPDELVSGAVLLLKVVEPDGAVRLSLAFSDGLGWLERAGMLRVAEAIEQGTSHLGNAG